MLKLYENIKKYRKDRGYTQTELAEKMGYADKSAISKIENGKVDLPQSQIIKFSDVLQVPPGELMGWDAEDGSTSLELIPTPNNEGVIPILGTVPAGIPTDAVEDIRGYIDVPASWVDDHGALIVKGDSMYPKYQDGDIVIYNYQPDCESGDDCVVYVNGDPATIKKVIKRKDGIILQPLNSAYEPMFFTNGDDLRIAGVIVEMRRKMK